MNDKRQPEQHEGFNIGDIYFVLFRRKWIILSFCLLGFVAAGVVYIIRPPQYESEVKLYIQYVRGVEAKQNLPGGDSVNLTTENGGAGVIQTEIEFLYSLDVLQQVVENIGAERILAKLGGGEDTNVAAGAVFKHLMKDDVPKNQSILRIAFQHPDKDVARDVLRCVVQVYIRRSADMRRAQFPEELLTNEIEQMRVEVQQTAARLNRAKQEAGIISTLEESKRNLGDEHQLVVQKLRDAEVQLSSAGVAVPGAGKAPSAVEPSTNEAREIPPSAVRDYQDALDNLARARKDLKDAKYNAAEGSPLLAVPERRVKELEDAVAKIEQKYPSIASLGTAPTPPAGQPPGSAFDGILPAMKVAQIQMMINTLNSQLAKIKADRSLLESKESEILELQQKADFDAGHLKQLLARVALAGNTVNQEGPTGIKVMESPTPAVLTRSKKAKKMMLGALAGGVLGGLALAFLIEMVLDRSVKRPGEIETKLRLPLFISIPDINGSGRAGQSGVRALGNGNHLLLNETNVTALIPANGAHAEPAAEEIAAWDTRHSLHRFYAGLRDRLIVNFEVRNLNHNPKLVGVTSCNKGAGVSTVAAGLAASLSETGDGNVLLVDMRAKEGAARQFFKGKPANGIDAELGTEGVNGAHIHDDLYAAGEETAADHMPSVLSKRFATLMPKLKASDYDYIIFDLPPVSQTSMTARLSGLMDMVLLVIESEKTNRDSVKRATALLRESKAHVSTVLNKVHTYVPTRLHQEVLDDEA